MVRYLPFCSPFVSKYPSTSVLILSCIKMVKHHKQNKMKHIILTMLSLGLLTSCNSIQQGSQKEGKKTITEQKVTKMKDLKSIAIQAQDAFFKAYSEEGVKTYFKSNYIQHNPHIPTGIEPVLGFLPVLKEGNTTYKTHRLLQDDSFIVFHNTYNNAEAFGANKVVTFDIWRMEDGMVAEHWDAVAPVVNKAETASGRSQFDGPKEVVDLDKTAENKQIVTGFVNDVLMGGNPSKITEYISEVQYDQHNIHVKDGLQGLSEAIQYLTAQNDMFTYKKVHKILGEGNFVLTQSEGTWHGKPQAFYDLFRVSEGKIVEHWDIIQEIPEKMAHSNGMF